MGYVPIYEPVGYWNDWDNMRGAIDSLVAEPLFDKSKNQIKSSFEFPTHFQLRTIGLNWLANQISRHHGGILSVRARMGYAETPESFNDAVLSAMKQFVKEAGA